MKLRIKQKRLFNLTSFSFIKTVWTWVCTLEKRTEDKNSQTRLRIFNYHNLISPLAELLELRGLFFVISPRLLQFKTSRDPSTSGKVQMFRFFCSCCWWFHSSRVWVHTEIQLVLIIVAVALLQALLNNYSPDTFKMLPIDPQHLNSKHKQTCKCFSPSFIH